MISDETIHRCATEMHRCDEECSKLHVGIRAVMDQQPLKDKVIALSENRILPCNGMFSWHFDGSKHPYRYVDGNHRTDKEYELDPVDEIERRVIYDLNHYADTDADRIKKLKESVTYHRNRIAEYKKFCEDMGKIVAWVETEYTKMVESNSNAETDLLSELGI